MAMKKLQVAAMIGEESALNVHLSHPRPMCLCHFVGFKSVHSLSLYLFTWCYRILVKRFKADKDS